jgi:hypothetical protein
MPAHRHLTFANLASATALVVAVTGVGGLAVADGTVARIAKGSVTSKHLKNGTIKTADLKDGAVSGAKVADGSLTGDDVSESTLGQVPAAASAADAATAANSGDVLRAVVAANGSLVASRSEHALSSSGANGFYTVVFDRNVSTCTTVVTAGLLNDNQPFGAHSSAALSLTNSSAVIVWTLAASNNGLTAYPFQLVVAC